MDILILSGLRDAGDYNYSELELIQSNIQSLGERSVFSVDSILFFINQGLRCGIWDRNAPINEFYRIEHDINLLIKYNISSVNDLMKVKNLTFSPDAGLAVKRLKGDAFVSLTRLANGFKRMLRKVFAGVAK